MSLPLLTDCPSALARCRDVIRSFFFSPPQDEPLLPRLHDNDFMALMDKKTMEDFKEKQVKPPDTWQYHCLMFQEGLVAVALAEVNGVV